MTGLTSPTWESRDTHSGADVETLLKHNDKPLLVRIDKITKFDGEYYKSVFMTDGKHESHPHMTLFESPILDTVDEAYNVLEAFADHPMRYARMFFEQEKHGK